MGRNYIEVQVMLIVAGCYLPQTADLDLGMGQASSSLGPDSYFFCGVFEKF